MKNISNILLILCMLKSLTGFGQELSFSSTELKGLPILNGASSEWGDFDQDGDMDVLLNGQDGDNHFTGLFRNEGNAIFTLYQIFPEWSNVSFSWQDADLDGRLDFFVTAPNERNTLVNYYYKQSESGEFVQNICGIIALEEASFQWITIDSDHYPDLLYYGKDPNSDVWFVFVAKNTGSGYYTYIEAFVFTGTFAAEKIQVLATDYDLDSYTDLIVYADNAIYFFNHQAETGSLDYQPALTQLNQFELPLVQVFTDSSGMEYFFQAIVDNREVVYSGGPYFVRDSTFIVPLTLEEGEYVFNLFDSYGDGLLSGGVRLKDAENRTIYSYTTANPGFTQETVPFCIGSEPECFSPPLKLTVALDFYPEETSWNILSEGNGKQTPQPAQMTIGGSDVNIQPSFISKILYQWFDLDQDGRYDALTGLGDDYWQWILDQSGTWVTTDSFASASRPEVLDLDGNGIAEMITIEKNENDGYEFRVLSLEDTLTTFRTPDPVIQSTFFDSTSNTLELSWATTDPVASFSIQLEEEGQIISQAQKNNLIAGDKGHALGSRMLLPDSGSYKVHLTAFGANGISSNSVSTAQIDVQNDRANDLFQQVIQDWPNMYGGGTDWIDFDNDGDLDLYFNSLFGPQCFDVYCPPECFLYENVAGNFERIELPFISEFNSAIIETAWGDYDGDGDLDAIVAVENTASGEFTTTIYTQQSGEFIPVITDFVGSNNAISWSDYDNDGDLDLTMSNTVLEGVDEIQTKTILYQNDEGTFREVPTPFTNLGSKTINWEDYDLDGDLDLFLGVIGEQDFFFVPLKLVIFENVQGSFEEVEDQAFIELDRLEVEFADYDNDGDPDVLLNGATSFDPFQYATVLYENNGGVYTRVDQELSEIWANAAWIDFDSDGDLDLFLTGRTYNSVESILYENVGGEFSSISHNIPGLSVDADVAVGDFDLDGRSDLLMKGVNEFNLERTRLYRNISEGINTTPTPPTNIQATVHQPGGIKGKSVTLDWDSGNDQETPASGLSYRIFLYRNEELFTAKVPFSTRGIPTNFISYYNLPPGDYEIYIQAIDPGYRLSELSEPLLFTIQEPFERIEFDQGVFSEFYSISRADYDSDGDLDILIFDELGTQLYRNDSVTFTAVNSNIVNFDWGGNASWHDYDMDGDLDLLVSGQQIVDETVAPFTILYENKSSEFTQAQVLDQSYANGIDWVDYDNDGDLDILFATEPLGTAGLDTLIIYQNSNHTFSGVQHNLEALNDNGYFTYERISSADFDNDGDFDLILNGLNNITNLLECNYYENIDGSYHLIRSLGSFNLGNMSEADFDSDGDLDFLIDEPNVGVHIFENIGGDFIEFSNDFPVYESGNGLVWGDYDNDGDLDLLRTGFVWLIEDQTGYNETKLYRNENGNFIDSNITLTGENYVFFDYDKDGDLDIYGVADPKGPSEGKFILYINQINPANEAPGIVTGLTVTRADTVLEFSWGNASDKETRDEALLYNFRLRDQLGQIVQPTSGNIGELNLTSSSNAGQNTFYRLNKKLDDGIYSWSVQAMDQSLNVSDFTSEQPWIHCYNFQTDSSSITSHVASPVTGINIGFSGIIPDETISFEWDFGDGSTSNELDPKHLYTSPGEYLISLISTSELGCTNSAVYTMNVSDDRLPVRIANVITPNGDGKNDFLYIENGTLYPEATLRVYNTQGQLLFEETNYQNDWYATYKGSVLPPGSYIAELTISSIGRKIRQAFTILN